MLNQCLHASISGPSSAMLTLMHQPTFQMQVLKVIRSIAQGGARLRAIGITGHYCSGQLALQVLNALDLYAERGPYQSRCSKQYATI